MRLGHRSDSADRADQDGDDYVIVIGYIHTYYHYYYYYYNNIITLF